MDRIDLSIRHVLLCVSSEHRDPVERTLPFFFLLYRYQLFVVRISNIQYTIHV
jgi:hypothetical protein